MGSPVPPWALGPVLPGMPPVYAQPGPAPLQPYTAAYGTGAAGSTTFQMTYIQNVAQGDCLVVAAGSNSATTAPVSVADSQGNSFQLAAIDTNRSPNVAFFVAEKCNPAVQSVDTITVTYAGTATVKQAIVRGYNGAAQFDAIDQVAVPADGNSTAPLISTAALGTNAEWAIVALANGSAAGVPAQNAWTGGFQPVATVGPGPYLTVADQLVNSPAALTSGATLPAVSTWTMLLITLSPVPMINPLSGLAPPGLIPPLAWQQLPPPYAMQGPPPVVTLVPPPPVPVLLRVPRQTRRALTPAALVPSPAPAPPAVPFAPRAARSRPRRAVTAPAPAPGAVSQPVPVQPPAMPRRQRPWKARPQSPPAPAPGAVSQPLPAAQLARPRRVLRRRVAASPGVPAAVPAAIPQQPRRRPWRRPGARPAGLAPAPVAAAPAAAVPGAARARRLSWRKPAARLAGVPAAAAAPPLPVAVPVVTGSRRSLLPRRVRPAGHLPGQGAVLPPARPASWRVPLGRKRLVQAAGGRAAVPVLPSARPRQLPRRRPVPAAAVLPSVPPAPVPVQPTPLRKLRSLLRRILHRPLIPTPTPPPVVPLPGDWDAVPASLRWQAAAAGLRWGTQPALFRWKAMMTDFEPISALSPEQVVVVWTSDLDGTVVDPTTGPMTVQAAFPVSSGNAHAPAQPSVWYPASWLAGGTGKGFFSLCPVGPGTTGPVLATGQRYDVWAQIPGTAVKFAGTLPVY